LLNPFCVSARREKDEEVLLFNAINKLAEPMQQLVKPSEDTFANDDLLVVPGGAILMD
jgi:hypothetical protein